MSESQGHHQHSHSHLHSHQVKNFNKVFAIGILLNIFFVLTEFYFGLKVDSMSLIADAGHNLSDVAGLALAWVGLTLSKKAGSAKHSYGWKKASILAAFGNSIFLLVAMGSLMWESIGRFKSPVSLDPNTIMIVAFLGILINSATAFLFFSGTKLDLNIRGAFLHMAADALVSVGVVLAGFISLKFGFNWIDPVTGIAISIVVIIGTAKLFFQSLHLMFDGVPDSVDFEEVKKYLLSRSGVSGVLDLHIWAMSTTEIALTAHLQMPCGSPGDGFLEEITEDLQNKFHIQHSTIQIVQSGICGANC
jgi:cobalt-zinc-cadmium efflux system protein